MRFPIVIATALALVAAGPGQAQPAPGGAERPVLRVTATGEAVAAPDMAVVTLGVTARADSAQAAMTQASQRTARILDVLTAAGIAPRDMQTSTLTLDPQWSDRSQSAPGPRRIEGFVARNTLRVRVRALDDLGTVLDDVLSAGANSFQGLRFALQEPGPVRDAALAQAVREARRKAELMAEAAGVALGPVLEIAEQGGGAPRPAMMMEARSAPAPVPVAEGELSLSATVVVEYALGPKTR